jgi:hypothetical protein
VEDYDERGAKGKPEGNLHCVLGIARHLRREWPGKFEVGREKTIQNELLLSYGAMEDWCFLLKRIYNSLRLAYAESPLLLKDDLGRNWWDYTLLGDGINEFRQSNKYTIPINYKMRHVCEGRWDDSLPLTERSEDNIRPTHHLEIRDFEAVPYNLHSIGEWAASRIEHHAASLGHTEFLEKRIARRDVDLGIVADAV